MVVSILDSKVTVPEHVVYRTFEQEMLLLNLETGQYHGLNESGGRLLELLKETGGRTRDAVATLAREYGVKPAEIEGDMAAFCDALAERGLVDVVPADAPPA